MSFKYLTVLSAPFYGIEKIVEELKQQRLKEEEEEQDMRNLYNTKFGVFMLEEDSYPRDYRDYPTEEDLSFSQEDMEHETQLWLYNTHTPNKEEFYD